MNKPHTKVIEKIRKSVNDGVKELRKVEAPDKLVHTIEKINPAIDWVEKELKEQYGD